MTDLLQDGVLDRTHTWVNANDRVMYEREFMTGTADQRRMGVALITASPLTSQDEIRAQLTAPPPVQLAPSDTITIEDIFGGGLPDAHVDDKAPTDYSGSNTSYTGSDRGLMSWY